MRIAGFYVYVYRFITDWVVNNYNENFNEKIKFLLVSVDNVLGMVLLVGRSGGWEPVEHH